MKPTFITSLTFAALSTCITHAASNYEDEVAFMRKHTEIIELSAGDTRLAIAPAYQGRVMTSTATGGKGTGFAGIENALFYADNTRMLYGDGSEMANALVSELKALDGGH